MTRRAAGRRPSSLRSLKRTEMFAVASELSVHLLFDRLK
jgi:hypothetical protein